MRILILSEPYPPVNPGGAGKFCEALIKALKSADPDIEFHIVCSDNHTTCREIRPEAVVHRLCVSYSGWSPKTFEDRKNIVLPYLMELNRDVHFDLVHDVGGFLYFEVFRLFCLDTGVPGITHLLLLLQPYLAARGYTGFIQKMFGELQALQCNNSQAVIITSSEEDVLYRQFINSQGRNHIIFNGISPIILPDVPAIAANDDTINVFIGGRVTDPVKGYNRGLQFIGAIKQATGLPVSVMTIDYSKTNKQDAGSSTASRIGNDQFYRVLREADIVLCPSYYEAFGLIALEALSLGTSVIAANTGGYKDILQEYQNGLLMNNEEWEQPGTETIRYFTELRFARNDQKKNYLPNQFNIHQTAADVFEIYKSLLNR